MMERDRYLVVREVADALVSAGDLRRCGARVEMVDGEVRLTICFGLHDAAEEDGLQLLELFQQLRYVADMGSMRALCARYGIEPEQLERLLPPIGEAR